MVDGLFAKIKLFSDLSVVSNTNNYCLYNSKKKRENYLLKSDYEELSQALSQETTKYKPSLKASTFFMYKKKTTSYWLSVNCMQHMKIKDKVAYKVEIHGQRMNDKWTSGRNFGVGGQQLV